MTKMKNIRLQQKKGFLPRDWLISLILFSAIVGLAALGFAAHAQDYDNSDIIDDNINSKYNHLANSTTLVSDALEAASESGGLSLIGTFNVLFASAFSVISLIFASLAIPPTIIANFVSDFGVPTEIAQIAVPAMLSIITIIIVMAVISTTTRRDI